MVGADLAAGDLDEGGGHGRGLYVRPPYINPEIVDEALIV
jgi:hypothetical protein